MSFNKDLIKLCKKYHVKIARISWDLTDDINGVKPTEFFYQLRLKSTNQLVMKEMNLLDEFWKEQDDIIFYESKNEIDEN